MDIFETAELVASEYTESKNKQTSFAHLAKFLSENPGVFVWRGKNKPDLNQHAGLRKLAEKYFTALNKIIAPSLPSTVPDQMVSKILETFYGHKKESLERIKEEHQHSMAAENMVGALLESYIYSVLGNHGWIWCCGEIVKSVDFIKPVGNTFELLQVKNRDNSENSSSAAIRNGTEIKHWFRTFSRTGKTNWDSFPDTKARPELSEEGFEKFVADYAKNL